MSGESSLVEHLKKEVDALTKKLHAVTEWHERAEAKIAQLQHLPDSTRILRTKIEDVDIAIPLLQNYDATIRDRESEIAELKRRLDESNEGTEKRVQAALEDGRKLRLENERLYVEKEEESGRAASAVAEMDRFRHETTAAQRELYELREQNAAFVANEMKWKDAVQRLTSSREDLEIALTEERAKVDRLKEAVAIAERRGGHAKSADDEERIQNEAQRVQLHLASRENEDKVHEIERLRNKMVQALKQAADNHNTHLKLVEEKHRVVVEGLKESARSHEIAVLKLRAQLARVDCVPQEKYPSCMEIVESHARQIQDVELKRLYAELTTAQLQRDEAIARAEQSVAVRRAEMDDRTRESRREVDALRQKLKDAEDRCQRFEAEANQAREALKQSRAEIKSLAGKLSSETSDRIEAQRRADDAKKQVTRAEEAAEAARAEKKDAIDQERRATRSLERRLEEAKRDEQSLKDRHFAELTDLQKSVEELRVTGQAEASRATGLAGQLREKDRQLDIATAKIEKLTHGLQQHKQQLAQCDEHLEHVMGSEKALKGDVRDLSVQLEHQQMEAQRLHRDKDRLLGEIQLLRAIPSARHSPGVY